MTLEDRVQAQRLHVFRRAEELGGVSVACREAGISRSLHYRRRKRYQDAEKPLVLSAFDGNRSVGG
jgi:hypothetical protein